MAAQDELHPMVAWQKRTFGCHHIACGRVLSGRRTAATHEEQEARMHDAALWKPHAAIEPVRFAIEGARAYSAKKGLPDPHQHGYEHVMQDPDTVRRVGRTYDALPEHDPKAVPHFEAMRKEIGDQFHHLTHTMGVKVHVVDHDPYRDAKEMSDDVSKNKRLQVLGTHVTGGHPVFSDHENDQFRAVHDFFGHAATGRAFDGHGEQAAYLAHSKMFSHHARPAMASETKAQNCSVILHGEFGPQKVALLPKHDWDDSSLAGHDPKNAQKQAGSTGAVGSTGSPTAPEAAPMGRIAISHSDDRIVRVAHDSGDGETVFHCPFCFTESTQFITKSGVRTFGETVGTTQQVLTAPRNDRTEGEWVDAHIHEFGVQPILRVTLKRNQRTKVVEATPEHRWLVKSNQRVRQTSARISRKGRPRDWRPPTCAHGHLWKPETTRIRKNGTRECLICAAMTVPVGGTSRATDRDVLTRDLKPGMRLSYLRHPGVGSLRPDEAGIRHGVVFGDGSAAGKYAVVHLWGEKDKQLVQYFPDRRYAEVNTADRVLGTGVSGVRVSGDLWAWMKALPIGVESPEYLYGWLAGYFAADGHVNKQGAALLSSANLAHLEAVRDIALGLGITTYGITKKMRVGFKGREPSALYSIEFLGSSLNEDFFLVEEHRDRYRLRDYSYERIGWTVVSVEDTGRTEKVYCAVVPETHSFALADNVWVGNCGSGQVIARSDGTIECEFDNTAFTVQVQPTMPAFPQTIDGQPIDVPGMPNGGKDANVPPGAAGGAGAPGELGPDGQPLDDSASGDELDAGDDSPDGDDSDDKPAFLKGSLLYRTAAGRGLTEDQYMRHLAIMCRTDDAVVELVRTENGAR